MVITLGSSNTNLSADESRLKKWIIAKRQAHAHPTETNNVISAHEVEVLNNLDSRLLAPGQKRSRAERDDLHRKSLVGRRVLVDFVEAEPSEGLVTSHLKGNSFDIQCMGRRLHSLQVHVVSIL